MIVRRQVTVERVLERLSRRKLAAPAAPLAGGPPGVEGPPGKDGKDGSTGPEGKVGEQGLTGTGTINCRLATAAELPAYTRTGNKIEANANGALPTIDSVAGAVNDFFLLRNGKAGADNGVYKIGSLGGVSSKWWIERIPSFDTSAECIPGMLITVAEGTQNGGVEFALLTTGAITLNTTALTFGYAGAWVAPTLENSWKIYAGRTVGYRRTRDGKIVLKGAVEKASGAATTKIFTLPAGFRPVNYVDFTCSRFGVAEECYVSPTGEVVYGGSASTVTFLHLDPISFYPD